MSVHEILERIPTLSLEERAQVKALLDSLSSAPESQIPEPDSDDRAAILRRMVERMKANPIPTTAPLRFTREELHERR
ncbi:MAG: DUF104 domain-containing protein [Acidobacteriota bacterium]|nr:DUF104 domain-containing protein [Acidobacteriota bacterium]